MSLSDILKTFNEEKVVVQDGPKFIEKDKDGISLKGVLQRGRLKLVRERAPYPQGVGFRPSGITFKFCRRAKIGQLAGLLDIYDDKPTPKLQTVFDMGHAIHDIFQGYFWDLGILRGDYHCLKCDKTYSDLLAPTFCPSGKVTHTRRHLRYAEIQATNKEYMIRGRCDGLLEIEGENHLVDFKSIANRTPKSSQYQFCFEDLDEGGPKPDHIVQLTLYMWMLDIKRAHLFYIAKNDHMVKSFAIPYDYSVIDPHLKEIRYLIDTAKALKAGQKVKLPVPCDNDACRCHQILSK